MNILFTIAGVIGLVLILVGLYLAIRKKQNQEVEQADKELAESKALFK